MLISGGFSEAVTSVGETMAARRSRSNQGKACAAGAALAFLVAWHAGPATASSNTPVDSDDVTKSAKEFDTMSPRHSLAPRVEAALRKVFKEPAMTTRVPGISDEQLARYKRQMYRKDI